jgi:hypothetical protein
LLFLNYPAMALTRVADKQLVSSSADETEPAILTYRQFGVDYSCSVWMNFSPNIQSQPNSKLYVTSWSSTGNENIAAAIPLLEADPNNVYRYADPVLVNDPTQNRIFLIALAIKTENSTTKVYSVLAWASTNAGWSWSLTPQVVAQARVIQFNPNVVPRLDKPVATVGPDGKLWVSWVRQTTDLRMRTATISGSVWTWSPAVDNDPNNGIPYDDPGILISSGFGQPRINGHNPQIMGDFNSVAYILFTDYESSNNWGRIGLIKYDASANPQFVSLADATNNTSAATMYTGKNGDDWLTLTASVRLRAGTVPSAKYDRTRGRISVTWHERNPNGAAGSRVQFATYKLSTGSWSTATVATSSGHNLLPAMDFDPANGNHMVTWYAIGSGVSTYTHTGSYVTFSGDTPIPGVQGSITNQTGADMSYLTPLSAGSSDRIVGDYHEVSFTNGAFKAAHIHAVSGGSNPWSFTVSP